MNFIKRLKDENKLEELANFIKSKYGKSSWEFKIFKFNNDECLNLLIDESEKSISWHLLTDFDCVIPSDLEASAMYIEEVDNATIRRIYLTYMKNTFPEYREEYIEHLNKIKDEGIEEMNSL